MRSFFKWVMVVTLTLSLGAHWALLQTVAWTGMLINYSQNATFTTALSKTFDGRHPCCLCKGIAKEKQSEKKTDIPGGLKKFDFVSTSPLAFPLRLASFQLLPAYNQFLTGLDYQPPTPPPRGLLS